MPQLVIYIFICIGRKWKVLLLTPCCQQMFCIYKTKSYEVTSRVLIYNRSLLLTPCCQQMFCIYKTKSYGVTSWVLINNRPMLSFSCCQEMLCIYKCIRLNLMGSCQGSYLKQTHAAYFMSSANVL
jgi:hypothetical protein